MAFAERPVDRELYLQQWFERDRPANLIIAQAANSRLPRHPVIHRYDNHGTSMIMSGNDSLAGLSDGRTVTSSGSESLRSGAERSFSQQRLLIQGTGGPELRPFDTRAPFQCYITFLRCKDSFASSAQWRSHCLSHFHGAGPPTKNQCCFCHMSFQNAQDNKKAWRELMDHLENIHFRRNERVRSTARPDFDLCSYMRNKELITDVQWKEMVSGASAPRSTAGPSSEAGTSARSSGPYTETNTGRRNRDARTRRQQ